MFTERFHNYPQLVVLACFSFPYFPFFKFTSPNSLLRIVRISDESLNLNLKKNMWLEKSVWERQRERGRKEVTEGISKPRVQFTSKFSFSIAHLIFKWVLTFSFWPNIDCSTFSRYLLILNRLKLDFISNTRAMYIQCTRSLIHLYIHSQMEKKRVIESWEYQNLFHGIPF